MNFLNDGKFAIGLFSGIVSCITLAMASDAFEIGASALAGALGVLLGSAISALPSFYTQWLNHAQIENERVRQHHGRRSALASHLHAKLLRAASHANHIHGLFRSSEAKATELADKRPSLIFAGVPFKSFDLTISDDELQLALEAIKGMDKLKVLSLQDEYNQLCEASHFYTTRRREAFDQFMSLNANGETCISYPRDKKDYVDAAVNELDVYFKIILLRSEEVFDRLTRSIIEITAGFAEMPEIESGLLRMELKRKLP